MVPPEPPQPFVGGLHAPPYGFRPEPVYASIVDHEEGARCDESSEHVMIEGKLGSGVNVLLERRRKPNVLLDDLSGSLSVDIPFIHRVGDAPAPCPSGARLLRNRERDARLESANHKCAFSVPRTPRYSKVLDVDAVPSGYLEGVNDATDTPSPRHHRRRGMIAPIKVVKLSFATTADTVLLRYFVVVECDPCNTFGLWK